MKFKKTMVTLGVAGLLLGSTVVFSEPGSESDPIVSLSYLNIKLEEIKDYIDEKISDRPEESQPGDSLVVVELQSGQILHGEAGTEIIKRSGEAVAIASSLGGLSDVTSGADIADGGKVPDNHLLIVPRSDGRGIFVTKDKTFVMVRGEYNIK
ncbi:MAG: hypothetical protein ACQEP4_06390 [Bacillota bacterium]